MLRSGGPETLHPVLSGFARLATASSGRTRRPRPEERAEAFGPLEAGWLEAVTNLLETFRPHLRKLKGLVSSCARSGALQATFSEVAQKLCALFSIYSDPASFHEHLLPRKLELAVQSLLEDLAGLLARVSLRGLEIREKAAAPGETRRLLTDFLKSAAEMPAGKRAAYLATLQSLAMLLQTALADRRSRAGSAPLLEKLCVENFFLLLSRLVDLAPGSVLSCEIWKILRRRLSNVRLR